MKFNWQVFYRVMAVFAILDACLLMTACGDWVSQATNIINLLVPAIEMALSILAAFGVAKGLSPEVMTAVTKWSGEATHALTDVVKPLIEQYKAAEAAAQPGILEEIKAALEVTVQNLNKILPTIHVTDPDTQAKIAAVVEAIAAEMSALINLVPAIQGKVQSHEELKSLIHNLKSAKEFREDFNKKSTVFGPQYKI